MNVRGAACDCFRPTPTISFGSRGTLITLEQVPRCQLLRCSPTRGTPMLSSDLLPSQLSKLHENQLALEASIMELSNLVEQRGSADVAENVRGVQAFCPGTANTRSQRGFTGGSVRQPSPPNRQVSELVPFCPTSPPKPQKRKSPAFARLSCKSWRETRDSNPGNAINVRRFSRPPIKLCETAV
jgi:hypothetical protein